MLDPCGNEKNVARAEAMALRTVSELALALNYGVDLVSGVGCLRITTPRCIQLYAQRAVPEQFNEPLALGAGQLGHGFADGELVPGHQLGEALRRMSRRISREAL
jgi:hypothetical protein